MKKLLLLLLLPLFASLPLSAQIFDWNVDFTYFLHNSEFDRSHNFSDVSQTVNAARLTPTVGLEYRLDRTTHRLMAGVDLVRDMGSHESVLKVFREPVLFYEAELKARNGVFSAIAGMFPRKFAEGDYRQLYFDRNNLFRDNNFEGFFVKWTADAFRAELGLDWTSTYGDDAHPMQREIFQALTSGRWDFHRTFSLGWTGRFHHFAFAPLCLNIVDDIMVSPYLRWTPRTALDLLQFDFSYVFAFQCDRSKAYTSGPYLPQGVALRQKGSLHGFGIENFLYAGEDIQPFRDTYGGELYYGDMMLHVPVYSVVSPRVSWADELAVFYSPKLTSWLHLDIAVAFQFGQPFQYLSPLTSETFDIPVYRGCRQVICLRADFGKSRMKVLQDNAKKRRMASPFDIFDHLYEL